MHSVKSGIFIMPFHHPSKELAQCHDEDMELAIRADELGVEEFWVGEHHTLSWEPIVSPEMFLAAVFRQTKQMRMGPAPILVNMHNPAQVANRLAFLDHFSHGRLDLAFGFGGAPSDFEMYEQEPEEMISRMSEGIDMILKIWSTEPPYSFEGKHWTVKLESVNQELGYGYPPKPYQDPYPPISVPVSSRGSTSVKAAAKSGFSMFSHSIIPADVLKDQWATYELAAQEAGQPADRSTWKIARTIFLADTNAEADKRARTNSIETAYTHLTEAIKRGPGLGIMKEDLSMSDSEVDMDYFMGEQIIAGDVDTALDRLLRLWEDLGPFGAIDVMSFDWDDADDKKAWLHSLELVNRELLPRFNKAVGAKVVAV
ncbi:MAG: LLM class flavin-dependent oxidoreductase [Dehalococcoidia bacterium]